MTYRPISAPLLTLASRLLLACGLLLPLAAAAATAVDDARYIPAGGIDQWIEIHGKDDTNPILFWLNGGPGGSTVPTAFAFEPWESQFTVVMWDQRGEGKTFEKYGSTLADTMSIGQMSHDGLDVAEYLHKRFPRAPIVLFGHSWGTVLGIHMIRDRPDLFAAYVGTGQVTSLPAQLEAAYPHLLELARKTGNTQALEELSKAGQPSAANPAAYAVVDAWSAGFEPEEMPAVPSARPAPEDRPDYLDQGEEFSWSMLGAAMNREDLPSLGTDFQVPMVFIQGELDYVTETSKVQEYYKHIHAPHKRLVLLPDHGHLAVFQDRDGFFDTLIHNVLPVVAPRTAEAGLEIAGLSTEN